MYSMRCIDTRLRAKERQVDTALCTLAACTRGIYHSNVTYLYGRRRREGGNSLCDSSWCVSGRKGREQGFIGHGYDPMCASSTISRSTNTRWPLLEKKQHRRSERQQAENRRDYSHSSEHFAMISLAKTASLIKSRIESRLIRGNE